MAGHDFYFAHIETLIQEMLQDPQVRLPGAKRLAIEEQARRDGITAL